MPGNSDSEFTETMAFTSELVQATVARDFPPAQHALVLAALQQCSSEHARGTARVHLAVLKLAAGRFDQVADLVSVAQRDYRDVIGPAEYPRAMASGGNRVPPTEAERAHSRRVHSGPAPRRTLVR